MLRLFCAVECGAPRMDSVQIDAVDIRANHLSIHSIWKIIIGEHAVQQSHIWKFVYARTSIVPPKKGQPFYSVFSVAAQCHARTWARSVLVVIVVQSTRDT